MSYTNEIPLSYTVPDFPSLYWPWHTSPGEPQYLYTTTTIWRFTLYWTLIAISLAHLLVATWAILMQFHSAYRRHRYLRSPAVQGRFTDKEKKLLGGQKPLRQRLKWGWLILAVYLVVGGIEALIAGSLVGLVLGAVYQAGYFRMSVWTPLFWGIINVLVLILSSFRISGGL